MIDPETDTVLIKPKGGFGGVGGAYAKPIALANVRAFAQRLNPQIQIIGTGGITNGRDAYDLILAGASLVQVRYPLTRRRASGVHPPQTRASGGYADKRLHSN